MYSFKSVHKRGIEYIEFDTPDGIVSMKAIDARALASSLLEKLQTFVNQSKALANEFEEAGDQTGIEQFTSALGALIGLPNKMSSIREFLKQILAGRSTAKKPEREVAVDREKVGSLIQDLNRERLELEKRKSRRR